MGHTSGALRSRNFASSARGLRPDGKSASMRGKRQAVLGVREFSLKARVFTMFTFTLNCHLGQTHSHRSRGDTTWGAQSICVPVYQLRRGQGTACPSAKSTGFSATR